MASGIDDGLFPFLRNLRQMPLYVIHGAKDQIMPVWLSQNITVGPNWAISFEGTITPQLETLLREVRRRRDPSMVFLAKLTVDVHE